MKFTLMMRDLTAMIHPANWDLEVVPRKGEEIELPDVEGRTVWLEVTRVQHRIDGKILVWLDTDKYPSEMIEDICREIRDEVTIG